MNDEISNVSSEIISERDYSSNSKPTVNSTNIVSKFKFHLPLPPPEYDDDGDLVVVRRHSLKDECATIEIEHSPNTILALVGLQIWRGAFLLADWLLFKKDELRKCFILELGAGVGLSSIVASLFAPVICTDINKDKILELLKKNIFRNGSLIKYPINIIELNFTQPLSQEVINYLEKINLVIAADVVYDNVITEAFVQTLEKILSYPPKKTIIIALEKRYVFTIADCDCVAPCYEYYLECVKFMKNVIIEEIPLDFPRYFEYERVKELVLWKLTTTLHN